MGHEKCRTTRITRPDVFRRRGGSHASVSQIDCFHRRFLGHRWRRLPGLGRYRHGNGRWLRCVSTATIVSSFNSQTNTFTFTVTNTANITQAGSTSAITGIGHDLPPAGNASASGLNGSVGMQAPSLSSTFDFSDGDVGNVPSGFNAAVLDFAFLTGPSGNFVGGSVNDGLLPGESASFTVSGAAFSGFTEEAIEDAIVVRFQNVPLAASSSGTDVGVVAPSNPVPEPSSIVLLAAVAGSRLGGARWSRATKDLAARQRERHVIDPTQATGVVATSR